MNDKLLFQVWDAELERLVDYNYFVKYLDFACKFPKYDFSQTLLVFAQKPDATLVADYQTWNNKVGRMVKKGANSISVFNDSYIRRSLFDISDTVGNRIPKQWIMNEEMQDIICEKLSCRDLAEAASKIAADITRENEAELLFEYEREIRGKVSPDGWNAVKDFYKELAAGVAAYYLTGRCAMRSKIAVPKTNIREYKEYYDSFAYSPELVRAVGIGCITIGSKSVAEIEGIMRLIIEEKRKTYGLQGEIQRGVRGDRRDILSQTGNGRTDTQHGQVRRGVEGIHERELPNEVAGSLYVPQVERNSRPGTAGGGEISGGAEEDIRETEPPPSDGRLYGDLPLENGNGTKDRTSDNGGNSFNQTGRVKTNEKEAVSETISSGTASFVPHLEAHSALTVEAVNQSNDLPIRNFSEPEPVYTQSEQLTLFAEREPVNESAVAQPSTVKNDAAKEASTEPVAVKLPLIDYTVSGEEKASGGAKTIAKANIEAIKLLKRIEKENRLATRAEQKIIAGYAGWGGASEVFNSDNDSFSEEYTELKELLTADEYEAARESVLTSFYTPTYITAEINETIKNLGFTGGSILEPSMGTGAFFSTLDPEIRADSTLYGVELDSLTSRIAKQLCQSANISNCAFEKTTFTNASFDVIVGNIPFGDFSVSDPKYDRYGFRIHDYFFASAIDKLKPGGVLAFITSTGTLDKKSSKLRSYVAQRADLVGAVRLPEGAISGTKTVSDIVFLQKREQLATDLPGWVNTGLTKEGYRINSYFVDNPQMLLGELKPNTRFGDAEDCTLISNGDLRDQLKKALDTLEPPYEFMHSFYSDFEDDEGEKENRIPADPNVRNFTHTLIDGELYYRENSEMLKVTATGTAYQRILGMHRIKLMTRDLIDKQHEGCSDEELSVLQNKLNAAYDKFIKEYGYISNASNAKAFGHDDDYNLIYALENKDSETGNVTKSDFFTKRTIKTISDFAPETAAEGLYISLDQKGKVDIRYIADICGKTPDEVVKELSGLIYLNPAREKEGKYEGYEEAGEYLSGNVRQKLEFAKLKAETDEKYLPNVKALEAVIPEELQAGDISVRLGATWIDIEDYNAFLYDTFKTPNYLKYDSDRRYTYSTSISIERNLYTGEWKIMNKNRDSFSVPVTKTYGTERLNAYEITERLLNQRDVVVKDKITDDEAERYVVNNKETRIAESRAEKISQEFARWIWADPVRREKYVKRYNDRFNNLRGRDYSNIKMSFPDMNVSVKLREHQLTAIARAVFGGNTLLAHCVGAGKTFEMAAATMEKKRLGLISKACVVVPKHLTLQIAREWQFLYPSANLLVATPKDFSKENRRRFVSRIVTGDYDAVIMSFQQFEKIRMSHDYRERFQRDQIRQVVDCIAETDRRSTSIKQLERIKKQMTERLNKLMREEGKDDILEFEKLGFDSLVVDEAHYYKNCFVQTRMSNVSGISITPAQKSEDMLMKTRYLNELTNYRGIIFATGTPVSNSMVELYVMQRYLRPDLLSRAGCSMFDDWAANFGEVVKQLEIKPAGNGYRMKSRFAKFKNLPELMIMYKEFADVVTSDMIKLPVPEIKNGKANILVAKPSEFQKEQMKELAKRSDNIHNGCDPTIDNMLKVTNDARLLGLDGRAIDPASENFPESKVNLCVKEAMRIYEETAEQKGVQIIWSDIAINEERGFSVYEYIKRELVAHGVPENEIAVIGEANTDKKRSDLFAKLRSGEKRFVFASTTKLGTGANIQTRLAAVHHLDIPWRPSDLEQRNGRIIRQGNAFKEVYVNFYTTESTFDTYMLSTVTNKQKFISQVMTSKSPARTMEDVDEMVLTYSEMQALTAGNPLIKEKIETDSEISRLSILEAEHQNKRFELEKLVSVTYIAEIEKYTQLISKAELDVKNYETHINDEDFEITIENKKYTERNEAGEALGKSLIDAMMTESRKEIGEYKGMKLILDVKKQVSLFSEEFVMKAILKGNLSYTSTTLDKDNPTGNITKISNTFDRIPKRLNELKIARSETKANLEAAKKELKEPFSEAEKLKKLRERIKEINDQLNVGGKTEQYVEESSAEAEQQAEAACVLEV